MDKPKIKRPGSGRTKNSFSFVHVSMSMLQAKFADPTQKIVVGRKWAEQMGFEGLTAGPSTEINPSIAGTTPATKIAVKTVDFDS